MQIINREVWPTLFITLLLAMSALSIAMAAYSYTYMEGQAANLITTGGVIYFLGAFVVSLVFNVPMNNRLDSKDYTSADAAVYWANIYVPRWTFWNYVRAASSGGAALCYLLAFVLLVKSTAGTV